MDEKNEKTVKNRFPQARRSYGEGCGLVRRWPPANFKSDFAFLGQVGFGCKAKSTGLKRGPCLAFLPTFFCVRNHLVA
jgi:hypothetical protein